MIGVNENPVSWKGVLMESDPKIREGLRLYPEHRPFSRRLYEAWKAEYPEAAAWLEALGIEADARFHEIDEKLRRNAEA